ncbi:unnamed protein product [Calypogeia fissa]
MADAEPQTGSMWLHKFDGEQCVSSSEWAGSKLVREAMAVGWGDGGREQAIAMGEEPGLKQVRGAMAADGAVGERERGRVG